MSQEKRILNKARITLKNGYADIQLSYELTDGEQVFYMDTTGKKGNDNIGSYVNLNNPIIIEVALFNFLLGHIDPDDKRAITELKEIALSFNQTVFDMPEIKVKRALNAAFDKAANGEISGKSITEIVAGYRE